MKILKLTLISSILWLSTLAFGQAVATLEDPDLLMGTVETLQVRVEMPNDSSKVDFPLLQNALQQQKRYVTFVNDTIEMLTSYKRALETDGGKTFMRYDLSIQAFDSGRYELPPMEFIVDGGKVMSNSIELNVLPVKVKADDKLDDFTDVAQPFEMNPNPEELEEEKTGLLFWCICGGIILLVLLTALYLLLKKRGGIKSLIRSQPPYKVALDRLRKLEGQHLPERGRTKEYYTKLTEILRSYLKKQFGIKTFETTSSEILQQMRYSDSLSKYEDTMKSILETADFVKFAKVNPSDVENARCMNDARRFIEVSHPEETSPEGNADHKKPGKKGGTE